MVSNDFLVLNVQGFNYFYGDGKIMYKCVLRLLDTTQRLPFIKFYFTRCLH